MGNFGENLREYRMAANLTQNELAELVGVNSGKVIYSWEHCNGKPDYEKIKKICKILKISSDALLGVDSDTIQMTAHESASLKKYRSLDYFGKKAVDALLDTEYERTESLVFKQKRAKLLQFDFYNIPASAGTGSVIEDPEPEKVYITETPEAYKADFLIKVKGDSMEPTFYDGDVVLVKKQNTLEIGEIGIFILNGDSYIKELGKNQLISHNKTYKPIKFTDDDNPFCSGKVLGRAKVYEK